MQHKREKTENDKEGLGGCVDALFWSMPIGSVSTSHTISSRAAARLGA